MTVAALLATAWMLLALAAVGTGALITDLLSASARERVAEGPNAEPAAACGSRRRAGGASPPSARVPHRT